MENGEKKRKYFLITKSKEECISIELKEFFEDPNKYLQNNSKFIIGNYYLNKLKIPKAFLRKNQNKTQTKLSYGKSNEFDFDKNTNSNELFDKIDSKPSSNNTNKRKFTSLKSKKRCISAFSPKRTINYDLTNSKKSRNLLHSPYSIKSNNISSSPLKSIHYEYKTQKEIVDIFNKFNNKDKDKKNSTINLYSNNKTDCKDYKYLMQEKSLKIKDEEKKSFNDFTKYLAQKCNKKEENLLLNKIENFNLKKQVMNYLYNKKLLSEKLGNNYWICNLRRSKYNYKINYINTGRNDKEPWEQIVDAGDMEIEYINNPSIPIIIDKGREINFFKNIKKYPKFQSFNKIKVEGKNLFNQEFNNFISNIDKKDKSKIIKYKLYKDPQEKKSKSIQELTYKENYRPLSRQKQIDIKRKLI